MATAILSKQRDMRTHPVIATTHPVVATTHPAVAKTHPVVAALRQAFQVRAEAATEPTWLSGRRAAAMARFVELGLPGRRDEAWRFTDLRPLTEARVASSSSDDTGVDPSRLSAHRLPGTAHRIVVANGRVRPDLSAIGELPPGVWLGSVVDTVDLRPDLSHTAFDIGDTIGAQPFASLNAALFADGFVLAIDPGVVLTDPVEVVYVGGSSACHLRNIVRLGAGSQATVVETFAGTGATWTNTVTSVEVGDDAKLRHVKVQAEAEAAIHIALTRARLAAASSYDGFFLIAGALLSRQDIQVAMTGMGANLTLNGAWLLRGEQEATVAPAVDHRAPGGQTSELFKGVHADRAHGVFLGSAMVREGADGTNARQLNRNLLTSPTARVDTKPELTIHADEVKCGHGATVGDLDEAALFYLLSRGIEPAMARHMLMEAFAAEVIVTAALAPNIDAHARRYLNAWLGAES
jgi:Fe-S cluster assembly protein SufD